MANPLAGYLDSAGARRALRAVQLLLSAAAVAVLAVKLHDIGWLALWEALPRSPAFYVAFATLYVTGPVFEIFIYSGFWEVGLRALPTFLRKRIYNELVIDYSGEAYLYLWAKRKLGLADKKLLVAIKDVNLLSGVASNAATLALVVALAFAGKEVSLDGIDPMLIRSVLAAAGLAIALVLAVVLFGRRILDMTRRQCIHVGAVHFFRMCLVLVLQAVQWGSALPEVPLSQWLMFLTAQMLLTRLPFLPNRDVILMWLGVTLAPAVAAPQAHVAAMFVAAGTLSLLAHAIVFGATSLTRRQPAVPLPA